MKFFECKNCAALRETIANQMTLFEAHRRDLVDQIEYLRKQLKPTVQPVNGEDLGEITEKPIGGRHSPRMVLAELSRQSGKSLKERQEQFKKEAGDVSS